MPLSSQATELSSYGGVPCGEIARRTGCSAVYVFEAIASTMDAAHELAAAGAESGTLVVAETQTAGRGREGRRWQSEQGGVWLTYLSRNSDTEAAQVLSIRIGLAIRAALDPLAESRLLLKWPNDVFDADGKVAGVLSETRWREGNPEWTAVGIGINLQLPLRMPGASSLAAGADRVDVLYRIVASVRKATAVEGALSRDEVQEYIRFDMLRGRRVVAPGAGVVVGISEDGELVISGDSGIQTARSGSVILEEDE